MKKESLIWGSGILILLSVIFISAYTSSNYGVDSLVIGGGESNISSNDYSMGVVISDISGNTSSLNYATQLGFYSANANITQDTYETTLNKGWNLISLNLRTNGSVENDTIALVEGWNLISSNYDGNLSFDNLTYTNSSGDEMSWDDAVAGNQVKAYLSYYDSSSALASQRKFKYSASSSLSVDDSKIRKGQGYWLYADEAGNLTLPSMVHPGGEESYAWSKLRFRNSSGVELNISDAFDNNWLGKDYIMYWDTGEDGFRYVCEGIYDGSPFSPYNPKCLKNSLDNNLSYFIYSNQDNLTLIRQN